MSLPASPCRDKLVSTGMGSWPVLPEGDGDAEGDACLVFSPGDRRDACRALSLATEPRLEREAKTVATSTIEGVEALIAADEERSGRSVRGLASRSYGPIPFGNRRRDLLLSTCTAFRPRRRRSAPCPISSRKHSAPMFSSRACMAMGSWIPTPWDVRRSRTGPAMSRGTRDRPYPWRRGDRALDLDRRLARHMGPRPAAW